MNKKNLLLALSLSATLALTACNSNSSKANDATKENTNQATEQTTNNSKNSAKGASTNDSQATLEARDVDAAKSTKEDAFDKFLELHPNAKVNSFALEYENGNLVYSVDGYDDANEYEVDLNSEDLSVIKDKVEKLEKDDDNYGDINKEMLSKIDSFIEKSVQDAGAEFHAKEYGIGYDDGILVAEVEVVNNSNKDITYEYNFETGDLIEKDM